MIHDVKKKIILSMQSFFCSLKLTAGPSIGPWRAPLVTDFYLDPVGIKPSGISHSASPQFQFSSKVIKMLRTKSKYLKGVWIPQILVQMPLSCPWRLEVFGCTSNLHIPGLSVFLWLPCGIFHKNQILNLIPCKCLRHYFFHRRILLFFIHFFSLNYRKKKAIIRFLW